MAELFSEIIPAILLTKKDVITSENEGDYVPFVVNKALSFHQDCIFYANQMNMLPSSDKLLQNHYYLNTVRAWKRPFRKWQKLETIENLDIVQEYYGYSNDKAKDALKLLTNEQIDAIKKRLTKGGLNDKSKRTNRGNSTRS